MKKSEKDKIREMSIEEMETRLDELKKELEQGVMAFAKRLGCHEVSAEEYIELEKKGEGKRAQEALAAAEKMIKEG